MNEDKKPSEIIKEKLIHLFDSKYTKLDDTWETEDAHLMVQDAVNVVVEYLDEEHAKPKYACPNCHRIIYEEDRVEIVTKSVPADTTVDYIVLPCNQNIGDIITIKNNSEKEIKVYPGQSTLKGCKYCIDK